MRWKTRRTSEPPRHVDSRHPQCVPLVVPVLRPDQPRDHRDVPGVRPVSAGKWVQLGLFNPNAPVPYVLTPKAEVELDVTEFERSGDD